MLACVRKSVKPSREREGELMQPASKCGSRQRSAAGTEVILPVVRSTTSQPAC